MKRFTELNLWRDRGKQEHKQNWIRINRTNVNKLHLIASNYSLQGKMSFKLAVYFTKLQIPCNYCNCLVINNKSHELISSQNLFTTSTASAQHEKWSWKLSLVCNVQRVWLEITQFMYWVVYELFTCNRDITRLINILINFLRNIFDRYLG